MSQWETVKSIPVEEYTTPSPEYVNPEDNIAEVKAKMKSLGVRHIPVIKKNKVLGILSDRDVRLIESCFDDISTLRADYVMTAEPYIVEPSTPLDKVVFHMSKEKIGSAIVQSEKDDYLGIFTSTDALNALLEVLRGEI